MSAAFPPLFPLSASRRLRLERMFPALIPALTGQGLGLEDAVAVAHNAALLFLALRPSPPLSCPEEVLERFSLREIAALCEQYGRLESGEEEWGVNASYREGQV